MPSAALVGGGSKEDHRPHLGRLYTLLEDAELTVKLKEAMNTTLILVAISLMNCSSVGMYRTHN